MTKLTQDQQAASDKFFDFLLTDKRVFILSGSAGTGKTFTMGYLKSTVLEQYRAACRMLDEKPKYDQVVYTATTNKAAEVLEKATGEMTLTVHKLFGLRVVDDYKTGKSSIITTHNTREIRNAIVFIDEASMIEGTLFDLIMKLTKGSKVVFVGDHAQMAPVDEEMSPIYENVDMENFVFLGEPVRNAGSPALVDLCNQLRQTVQDGIFRPIKAVPGVIDYLEPKEMNALVDQQFAQFTDDHKILCYTNKRVMQYNQYIRKLRGQAELPDKGEVFITASTFVSGKQIINTERQVEITDVNSSIKDCGYSGYASGFSGPLTYREIVVKTLTGPEVCVAAKLAVDPAHLQAVLKSLSRKKDWPQYFALKNDFIDLRDRDASTVYKAQGSTYHTVFIDLGNIGTSYNAAQVARMLFVAVSRATTRVYLYGNLPGRYVGKDVA